eukprot:m.133183 g.133183  ORF g.133183 m.133183 type:complete len:464 (-) comp14666_c0_seq4:1500-2891(-)
MPRELRAKGEDLSTIIRSASLKRVKRRDTGGKHYVYEIKVLFEDGSEKRVFRRFSLFSTLREKVADLCKDNNVDASLLPSLPSKLVVGRSHVRKVAEERIAGLQTFLKGVLDLPQIISRGKTVRDFLTPDLEDFKDAEDNEADSSGGEEELPELPISSSIDRPYCTANIDYDGEEGLRIQTGDIIYLRRTVGDDWLEGELNGMIGCFPRNYVTINVDLPKARAPPPSSAAPTRSAPPASAPPTRKKNSQPASEPAKPNPIPERPKPPSAVKKPSPGTPVSVKQSPIVSPDIAKLAAEGALRRNSSLSTGAPKLGNKFDTSSASQGPAFGVKLNSTRKPTVSSTQPAPISEKPAWQRKSSDGNTSQGDNPSIRIMFQGKETSHSMSPFEASVVHNPTFVRVNATVKKLLSKQVVLNYRDACGDLIAIHDDDDLALYASERKSSNQLDFEATLYGDFQAYNKTSV